VRRRDRPAGQGARATHLRRVRRAGDRRRRERHRRAGQTLGLGGQAPPDGVRAHVRPRAVLWRGARARVHRGARMSGHLLSVLIFFPLLGVLAIVVGGREMSDATARWLALFVTLVTFGLSIAVLGRFDHSAPGFQLVEQASWVPSIGLQWIVGVDGISLWLVLLTTFLFPVSVLASWTVTTDVRRYMIAMLALET